MSDLQATPSGNELTLAELERFGAAAAGEIEPARLSFRQAAAVLCWFDPKSLRPVDKAFRRQSAVRWILADSKRVIDPHNRPSWTLLEPVRRQTLRGLASADAMAQALAANPERPDAAVQRAFEALVHGEAIDADADQPEQLAGLLTAVEWLEGILPNLPEPAELRRRAGLARLLAPLRQLVGTSFQGREEVLKRLRDYVGVPASDDEDSSTLGSLARHAERVSRRLLGALFDVAPLFIWGAGGVGKSTVIAKFVLSHAVTAKKARFPFVYLNFDRTGLVPDEPLTLLREAARVIAIQYPQVTAEAEQLSSWISDTLASRAASVSDAPPLEHSALVDQFVKLLKAADGGETPLLWILDTFEEVQYLGTDRVQIVWKFLELLQSKLLRISIVVAGRSRPEGIHVEALHLHALSRDDAEAFVQNSLAQSGAPILEPLEIALLLDTIGTVPLSLKLAIDLLVRSREHGISDLKKLDSSQRIFGLKVLRAKAASVQGLLYGRILDHIHDEDVRKLAFPGLIMRRISAEIIEQVLAGPCRVAVRDREHAEWLFNELAREATLVEVRGAELEHRSDIRRLILKDLKEQFAEQVETIHRLAVDYFTGRPESSVRERAEEIYHRLCLKQPEEAIAKRWLPGVGEHLKSAIEELEPAAQTQLAKRLRITPDRNVLAKADLQEWEAMTAISARRHLEDHDPKRALALVRERKERSDGSPIYAVEAEALRLLGKNREGLKVALAGIEAAARVGDLNGSAELRMICCLIHEVEGELEPALVAAQEARELAAGATTAPLHLRAAVAVLRLHRKLGRETDIRRALKNEVLAITDHLSGHALRRHPTLLRELAAELGSERLDWVRLALRYAGLETAAEHLDTFAELLGSWDREQQGATVAASVNIDGETPDAWRRWVARQGRKLGRTVADLVEKVEISESSLRGLVEAIQLSVDLAIRKTYP